MSAPGHPRLDRLIRVRRIRARHAMAALGRAQAAVRGDTDLIDRVAGLVAAAAPTPGRASAGALVARAGTAAMLGGLAEQLAVRLAVRRSERDALATALARAQAAVDAALARRQGEP